MNVLLNRRFTSVAAALMVALLLTGAAPAPAKSGTKLRVYHIGNSVTDTLRYRSLEQMAASKGDTYVFGRDMIPGAPLQHIWQHPEQGIKEKPYGGYDIALKNYEWDVITLQPFDRQLESSDGFGDLTMAKNFIDLALPKSPDAQFYIYQRWPKRKELDKKNPSAGYAPFDYEALWERKYTRKWDGSYESRDFFEKLTLALREAYPDMRKPVRMVPVGDVLFELDKRAKAGEVPGLKGVEELYVDSVHFNNVGAFVVGTTFYATMFKKDPAGADFRPYGPGTKQKLDQPISKELAEVVQKTVWDVVAAHPYAGVGKSEPTKAARR
jgi:hypothetical protein